MNQNKDRFNWFLSLQLVRLFHLFYAQFKEQILYLLFGGLAFFLSIGLFAVFVNWFEMDVFLANVIDWLIVVSFAFVTNRTWVFTDRGNKETGIVKEFGSFMIGRFCTLLLEDLVLWGGIIIRDYNSMFVKIVAQILVIIANYLISKFLVFRKS